VIDKHGSTYYRSTLCGKCRVFLLVFNTSGQQYFIIDAHLSDKYTK